LPDPETYGGKKKAAPVPKDTLNKMGIDTSDKKGTLKDTSKGKKKPVKHQVVAAILRKDEDEQ